MSESNISRAQTKELLVKRRNALLILSEHRKQIEAVASRDDANQHLSLKRDLLGAVCAYIAGDFHVFLDSDIKDVPRPPVGDVEATDKSRQQFALEVYCNPDPAKREILERCLREIIEGSIELHRRELYDSMDISDKEGMHFNGFHRVAGVIEYPPDEPQV